MKIEIPKNKLTSCYLDDHYNLGNDYNFELIHNGAIADIKLEARILGNELEIAPILKKLKVNDAEIHAEHWTNDQTEKLKELGFTTISDVDAKLKLPKDYFSNWEIKFTQISREVKSHDVHKSLYFSINGFDIDFENQQIHIEL